jgi:hypothetical protein
MSGLLLHRTHYELMQRVARFSGVRRATMAWARRRHGVLPVAAGLLPAADDPVQATASAEAMRAELERDGVSPRLALHAATVDAIARWAEATPCYAYENPAHGFLPADRARAETVLGRPILKAVYFNPDRHCAAMEAVCRSPAVHALAAAYLGAGARLVSRQLWWTFPTQADEKTRKKVAHFYHRDIDDWAFLKFFFYITPVQRGDGSHHFVVRSHRPGWRQLTVEGLRKTRWTDEQVRRGYGEAWMRELDGPAGLGFAEDTFGLHKAQSPSMHPRLMLSLVFQLNDYHLFEQDDLERQARLLELGPDPAAATRP